MNKENRKCTDVRDVNGKIIYEGDIVEYYADCEKEWQGDELTYRKTSVITYGGGSFYIGDVEDGKHLSFETTKNGDKWETIYSTVIGNIWDTPSLVEK
jgi:uncharacterized phage protein (TIGR01671 family)